MSGALDILGGPAGGANATAVARASANQSTSTGAFQVGTSSGDPMPLVVVAGFALLAAVLISRG